MKDELRAITKNQRSLDSAVMMSSLIPSEKYSCWGSPVILVKGSTANRTGRRLSRCRMAAFESGHCADVHRCPLMTRKRTFSGLYHLVGRSNRRAVESPALILEACPQEFQACESLASWQTGRRLLPFPSRQPPLCR